MNYAGTPSKILKRRHQSCRYIPLKIWAQDLKGELGEIYLQWLNNKKRRPSPNR